MAAQVGEGKPLPNFRKDLRLFQGPSEPDGSPTYTLYDPIRAKYFKVNWVESLFLKHYESGMTANALADEINTHSTVKITPDQVLFFFEDAKKSNLLSMPKTSEEMLEICEKRQQNPILWLLFHYLYIRIPIMSPDRFLQKTLPFVLPLISKPALLLYALLTTIGIIVTSSRLDEFLYTFPYFFSAKGIFSYAVAVTCVKFIHEFAHAYTAAYLRVNIPSMGIALIIMWPVLYTNVTDSWKLVNRKHRFYISVAGVSAELIIAGLATFFWAFSDEGLLKSIWFIIASASWITSLLINVNPAMRFDGYYLLSDLWGIDNLQNVSFAATRWKLRQWFLGLDIPTPYDQVPKSRLRGFIIYSIYTWLYRIGLYTTIALFVYHSFTKVIGLSLFILEIGVFMVWPLYSEAKEIYALRKYLKWNWKLCTTLSLVTFAFLAFAIPYPHVEYFPAITAPVESQTLYAPYQGILETLDIARNQSVEKGDFLYSISSREQDTLVKKDKLEKQIIQRQIHALSVDEKQRPFLPEKQGELVAVLTRLDALKQTQEEYRIHSHVEGEIIDFDETLRIGQPIAKDQIFGKIADTSQVKVLCYVPEKFLDTIREQQHATFRITSNHQKYYGKIEQINPERLKVLKYPALSSTNKGEIPVSEDTNGRLIPIESYYPVTIQLDPHEEIIKFDRVGWVEVRGPARSWMLDFSRKVMNILWQESGV